MAIRLTDDDNNYTPSNGGGSSNNDPRRNNNNNSGLFAIIALLFKKSPLLAIVAGLGVLAYIFLFNGGGGSGLLPTDGNNDDYLSFSTGCSMDEGIYDKAYAFEPLDLVTGSNRIPASASLEKYIPSRRNQGQQGSCVGWASTYAARTIIEAKATGKDPNSVVFSPAFVYNQIRLNNKCEGAYMLEALKTLKGNGAVPFSEFPYNENSCTNTPGSREMQLAKQYTIENYTRLTESGISHKVSTDAIKQHLANGGPVVIGMMVPPSFDRAKGVWQPTNTERQNSGKYGGHAMCVIGYDDNKQGGAFRIMNSWGEDWGDKGLIWVTYSDFEIFTREAYGVAAPLEYVREEENLPEDYFKIQMGLWLRNGNSGNYMALKKTGTNTFENTTALKKGDSFKVGVNNGNVAYIYIFGAEASGESYQLFPYAKTSAYFNITGTRLFPKEKSFTVDEVGNKDYMAIVVSKEELSPEQINASINASKKSTYAERVTEALGNRIAANPNWRVTDKGVEFDGKTGGKSAMLMVFGIHKK